MYMLFKSKRDLICFMAVDVSKEKINGIFQKPSVNSTGNLDEHDRVEYKYDMTERNNLIKINKQHTHTFR